jgi:hypothetical protein
VLAVHPHKSVARCGAPRALNQPHACLIPSGSI